MTERLVSVQAIVDADDLPCFALDRELRYTAFNRAHASAMRELYGAEIALGGRLPDYQTVAADREAAVANLERALAGERVVAGTFSGEEDRRRYFDIVHAPLRDDAGAVVGIVVRAQDVNRSYRSDRRYGLFVENNLEGFAYCRMLYDDEGRPVDWVYLAVNPAFERLTGLTAVVGRRVTEIIPAIRDETPELFDVYSAVVRTGAPAEFDIELSPLGLWLHVTVLRPEPDHFVAVFSDLTESKRAEQALAATVDRLNEAQAIAAIGSWEWDLETDQVWWSDETYRVFGVTPEEFVPSFEANGRFIHPEDFAAYGESFSHSLKTGEPLDHVFRLNAGDGRQKHCSARGRTVCDADGRPIRFVGTVMDITGSRRAEEKLRASEEDFRTLAEAVPQIVWMTDADGKNTFFNQQWVDYTGMTLEESYGDGWNTPFHPDDRQRAWEAWQRATRDDVPYSLECRLRRADGAYRWWLVRGAPWRDESGTILRWFGTCTYIEEIKQTAERLRRSERNLAEAERIGGTGSWDYDVTSDTASWSDNMFRIFDVDPAMPTELVFAHFVENLVHPADRPHLLSVFQDALAGKRPYDLEYRVVKKDGSIRDVHAVAETIRDEHGNALRMIGRVEDVTERKQAEAALRESEEQHRKLFESMAQGVVYQDAEGHITAANAAAERILGLALAQMQGVTSADPRWRAVREDGSDFPGEEHPAMVALRTGRPVNNVVFGVFNPADDAYHWIRVGAVPRFRPGEDAPCQVFATLEDVTEQRRAEAEIRRLNAELEQRVVSRTAQLEATNKELEAFAYSISHDLRAPLRAIDGFSQMVFEDAGDKLGEEDLEHLQRVRAGAQRMAALIDDLLGLSRVSRHEILLEEVDVSALAGEVLAELREAQPERRVETAVAPGMRAVADGVLVRAIFANLLSNAWKFTSKHKTARIEVGVAEVDGERAFFVRDDGAGFDREAARHLFGAFQRFHTLDEFEGDGIGLATVQRLVTRLGGRVWAEAAVEKGATFSFTLPGKSASG